jgi:DNA-binding transcriptional LysR family regulator
VFIADEAIAAGKVVTLLNDFVSPELGIHAMLPSNRQVPHRVRVLMDFLAQHLL